MFAGQPVGSTDLEFFDDGIGVAHGDFYPDESYKSIRGAVVSAAEARHHRLAGHVLPRLYLVTAAGQLVQTSAVVIDDFDDVIVTPEIAAFLEDREEFDQVLRGLT